MHKWAEPSLHFGSLIKRHIFEALHEEPPVDSFACLGKVLRKRPTGISEFLQMGIDRRYVGLGLLDGLLCAGEVILQPNQQGGELSGSFDGAIPSRRYRLDRRLQSPIVVRPLGQGIDFHLLRLDVSKKVAVLFHSACQFGL